MEIATSVYSYTSHLRVDRHNQFIRAWTVSDAARHDSRELAGLLDKSNIGSIVVQTNHEHR